ncbi:caspase family protein [Streptomyces sp. NPDC048018]|uniref:HD domain-containing protein n=1 Tax=Streptomyces sp. NPDC048018 TaxID=3365499 RepID=UPI00371C24A9
MGTLRALLIAVPGEDLGFAVDDVARIRKALVDSGYAESDVTVLDSPETTTRSKIYGALDTLLEASRDGDFTLVYFSGHGIRFDEVDHLVPTGADPRIHRRGLIAVAPDDLLERLTSQATVMMCLDACRDEADEKFQPPQGLPRYLRMRENVVFAYACAAGLRAMGTPDGSFMGRALAEALSKDTLPRTVGEVLAHVRKRTPEFAEGLGVDHEPEIRWLDGSTGGSHAQRVVCGSEPGTEGWQRAVRTSALWQRVAAGRGDPGELQRRLDLLVGKVIAVRRDTGQEDKAGPDPWEDPTFPERVLAQLDRLVPAVPEGRLGPLEAVTLVAAPFVREAAVACGRRALAELYDAYGEEGARSAPGTFSGRLAEDMADVRKAYGQIDEKRRRLGARPSHTEAAKATEQWLRHQLLADWDQLWDASTGAEETVGALESLSEVMRLLTDAAVLAVYPGGKPPQHAAGWVRHALQQVVMQMRTRPGPVAPDGKEWDDRLPSRLGPQSGKWRPRQLTGLLHVAELLAIDPRLLDGIVVDHLGVDHLRVEPGAVVRQVAASEFIDGTSADLTLHSACENAALHVALERQVDAVGAAVRALTKDAPNEDLYTALPKHVGTDSLAPEPAHAYEAPPPRFQLSEDGIKPLIMGTQLYGDHTLAVRELYQNALDACRRRQARQQYAAAVREISDGQVAPLASYTITFTLGRDAEDGRVYIECRDPGIGMTAEELRDLFARAGRRFEQSPARVREMRRWRREGIVPEQNSRFGIGVFSYFMLAEAIQVTTRPASGDGRAAGEGGHRVDVVADSGLMHITKAEGADVGTRVRLYLRPEYHADPPPLAQVLRDQVWYSDVAIEVVDELSGATGPVRRPAGELRVPGALPLPRRDDRGDVWWVPGLGARLVDGVFVRGDEKPHGYVVNLRRRHKPVLSADRNRLQGFEKEVVREDLRAAIDDLLGWQPIPLDWLWDLSTQDIPLAQTVLERLLAAEVTVDVRSWYRNSLRGHVYPLTHVGCLPMDHNGHVTPAEFDHVFPSGSRLFLEWRQGLVSRDPDVEWQAPSPLVGRPKGFPRTIPLDSLVFQQSVSGNGATLRALLASVDSGLSLRATLRVLRRHAVAGVDVPEVADLRQLDDVVVDQLTAELYMTYTDRFPRMSSTAPVLPGEQPAYAPLIGLAASQSRTLGEMADALATIRALDIGCPPHPELGALAGHVPSLIERLVLTGESHTGLDLLPLTVTPVTAAYVARYSGVEATEVAAIAERYSSLGYGVTGDFDGARLSDAEIPALDLSYDRTDRPFGLLQLIRMSARRADPDVATTYATVHDTLLRLGLPGLRLGALASVRAPSWWTHLGPRHWENTEALSVWTVLRALEHRKAAGSPEAETAAVAALEEGGVVAAGAAAAVRTWLGTPAAQRPWLMTLRGRSLSGPGGESTFPARYDHASDHVSTAFLVTLAADRGVTLGAVADELRSEAEPYGITVARIPADARGLKPDLTEFSVLFTDTESEWRSELTHREIVEYAEDRGCSLDSAVSALRRYECLGGPRVPRPSAATAEGEVRDPALERLLFHEPLAGGTVTPLALVTTAVRLERGLRSMHRALAPYARIGLVMECPEPEDDTYEPDWQDVIILSRYLTGREPAVSGEVTEDHIRLCSEETELTVPQVRERLGRHAPLFGLTVPAPRTEQEEPA